MSLPNAIHALRAGASSVSDSLPLLDSVIAALREQAADIHDGYPHRSPYHPDDLYEVAVLLDNVYAAGEALLEAYDAAEEYTLTLYRNPTP